MERFSIPSMELLAGNESLADSFGPNGTRMIPCVEDVVRVRAGTGVSLIARQDKRRRKTIAALLASIAGVGTMIAIYLI